MATNTSRGIKVYFYFDTQDENNRGIRLWLPSLGVETLSSKNIFKDIISSSFSVQMFSFILTFLRIGRYHVVHWKTNNVCKQSVTIFFFKFQSGVL